MRKFKFVKNPDRPDITVGKVYTSTYHKTWGAFVWEDDNEDTLSCPFTTFYGKQAYLPYVVEVTFDRYLSQAEECVRERDEKYFCEKT